MQTEEEQSGQQDSTSLLPFHRRMVQELTDADGICVMAAGALVLHRLSDSSQADL